MDTHDLVVLSRRRQEHVDRVLDRFFSLAKRRAEKLTPSYLTLWTTLESNTRGGKRFRPQMVLSAYEGCGGTDFEAAAHLGAAYEMLHTALIVHDDVIDRDFVRRGAPNVSGAYRDSAQTAGIPIPAAEHRGTSVGVIAGDLALAGANRLIEGIGADDDTRSRLVALLDDAIFASAAGELADVDFSLMPGMPSVDEVTTMERLKTAVYSFEAPLQSGAVLAGAPDDTITALGAFGRDIGIAYQIVDDLLGVFGTEASTGKSTIGDLREGKRTVLIAYAAETPQWGMIEPMIGDATLSPDTAANIRAALEECGARAFAESLARDYGNRAWETLSRSEIPSAFRDEIRPLVATVLERVR